MQALGSGSALQVYSKCENALMYMVLVVCVLVIVSNFVIVFLTAPLGIKDMPPPLGAVAEWAGMFFWPALAAAAIVSCVAWVLYRIGEWAKKKTAHIPRPL
jgi:membrane protein DedA with SNARE-associated domain